MLFFPPEQLHGPRITLRRYLLTDAEALKESIQTSLDHLRAWMPWAAQEPTDASVAAFLIPAVERFGREDDANYAITLADGGRFIGGCDLMPRIGDGGLEIGYWVDVRHVGQGIATEAARLLTDTALELETISRVEIHCDEGNLRSAAIPRRLGYRLDRIEPREVETPSETGRTMVWIADRPAREDERR